MIKFSKFFYFYEDYYMKNIIISTFALSCIWLSFTIVASDKSDARVIFEQAMYAKSGGILPKEEYKKLINPFLNKAEKELRSVQFCEQNSDCIECQNYFNTLLNYNVACFQNYVQNNKFTNIFFEKQKIKLEN